MSLQLGSELKNGLGVVIGLTSNSVAAVTGVDAMGRDNEFATWSYDANGNTFNGHYALKDKKTALADMVARS